jgi:hypothetical protein
VQDNPDRAFQAWSTECGKAYDTAEVGRPRLRDRQFYVRPADERNFTRALMHAAPGAIVPSRRRRSPEPQWPAAQAREDAYRVWKRRVEVALEINADPASTFKVIMRRLRLLRPSSFAGPRLGSELGLARRSLRGTTPPPSLQAGLNCRSDMPLPVPLDMSKRPGGGRLLQQAKTNATFATLKGPLVRKATGLKRRSKPVYTSRFRSAGLQETECPTELDWVAVGVVPPVLNQGQVSEMWCLRARARVTGIGAKLLAASCIACASVACRSM